MTYRHHSLRCHHRVQNTQGSNQHQFRITCQQCQGHLAIVHGRHLNVESRLLIQEYLETSARAAAATPKPPDEPEPAESQEDVEVHRARVNLKIAELNREIRRLTAELEGLPRQATPPPPKPPDEPERRPRWIWAERPRQ